MELELNFTKKDIFSESRPMWSFIADTNGSPLYKIQIDSTKNSNFDNMFVGIYPMFVYTPKGSQFPISLSAVSQDKFKKVEMIL